MKGFINIIKPKGMSSAYAVGAVKHKLKVPCGHMGTLDPMASGILPIGIGKTSRLFQFLLDKTKTYEAVFRFGALTDTLDITGTVTMDGGIIPTEEQIKAVLPNFIGEIEQVPPNYSAKCIDGKRGYELARRGVEFSLPAKKVTILNIEYLGKKSETDFAFKIDCKGGTYIRSLARDIGVALNTYCIMAELDRTACGVFTYENGVSVEEFKASNTAQDFLLAPDIAIDYPKLVLTGEQAQKILDGVFLNYGFKNGIYRVYNQREFWGVGEAKNGVLKIKAYVR